MRLPRPRVFLLSALGCCLFPCADAVPSSGLPSSSLPDQAGEYHTPLAGKEFRTELFGRQVHIPERDRDNTTSLVAGGTIFTPSVAGENFLPIGALYWKYRWDEARVRGVFSIFHNVFDLSRNKSGIELLGHLDNMTDPFPQKETVEGNEVDETSVDWGSVNGRLGIGMRFPVFPFEADSWLRAQLFYQAGWLYSSRTSDTGPGVRLPPDTLVHGPLLRVRYDGLRRNFLELPHDGFAAGADAIWTRRDTWSDADYGNRVYYREDTRDSATVTGYLLAAGGIPGLSGKNRLIFRIHGGFAPYGDLDRFSAFRIGGGPIPTEDDDLCRLHYPGAYFNQFPASDYLLTSLHYRRELLFFLYLRAGYTYGSINRLAFTDPERKLVRESGGAFSTAIETGFFWDSKLLVEYSLDWGLLRGGRDGSSIFILWNKDL